MKKLLFYITIILTLSTNNIILADDFFTEQRKTFINNYGKEEEKQYNYDMMRDDTIYDSDIKKVEWSTYEYNDIEKKMIELINSYKKSE